MSEEVEQIPVEVKLVDVCDEMKQGYRQVPVFMTEPPPVSFGYCFKLIGVWLLASLAWAGILFVPLCIIMAILSRAGKI